MAGCADGSPPRLTLEEQSREAAPTGEVESTLVVFPGCSEPPNAFLEAMVREESWLQMVRGDGPVACFDAAALDAARR